MKSLRLLRNGQAFDGRETANGGLIAQLTGNTVNDGEILLARYTDGDNVKTLIGVSAKGITGHTGTTYTIFDSESVPSDVQDAIDNIIGGEVQGEYDTIVKIDSALTIINGDDSTEGSIAYGDKKTYESAVTYVTQQIQGLDVADSAVAKNFVTEVSETDGKIAVKRGAVTSTGGTIVLTDGADGGINIDVVSTALTITGKDAIKVAESGTGKEISLAISANDKVLSQTTDGLLATFAIAKLGSANGGMAASYQLQDKTGNPMGVTIDIPKDMVISAAEVKKVGQADQPYSGAVVGDMYIDFTIANATSDHIYLPAKTLFDAYVQGNGIEINGNKIAVKRDAASEGFLTVGADGVKISGVQEAINAAAKTVQDELDKVEESIGLEEDGSFTAPTGATYVSDATTVIDAIKKLDTQAKANATAITQETADREAADSAINETITEIQGQIDEITGTALSISAGNGITIEGGNEEAKTISAKAADGDPIIEVTADGIKTKDNAVWDCGTY